MSFFSKGRPVSAGGSGQPPAAPRYASQLEKIASSANPLLGGSQPSWHGGSGGGGAGVGGGGGRAPITGYGALAGGARGDGYWGPKPSRGGGGGCGGGGMGQHDAYDDDDGPGRMRDDTSRKRKHDDVWRPNQTTGKLGKQPKPPKSPSSSQPSKPKPVAGASADGSPYRPPLRRCVVSSKAVRAMQTAVDAPLPPGLLQESDVHLSSSAPDLAYLERSARRRTRR